jgi:hypothetical protein
MVRHYLQIIWRNINTSGVSKNWLLETRSLHWKVLSSNKAVKVQGDRRNNSMHSSVTTSQVLNDTPWTVGIIHLHCRWGDDHEWLKKDLEEERSGTVQGTSAFAQSVWGKQRKTRQGSPKDDRGPNHQLQNTSVQRYHYINPLSYTYEYSKPRHLKVVRDQFQVPAVYIHWWISCILKLSGVSNAQIALQFYGVLKENK